MRGRAGGGGGERGDRQPVKILEAATIIGIFSFFFASNSLLFLSAHYP